MPENGRTAHLQSRIAVIVVVGLLALLGLYWPESAQAATTTSIAIDGTKSGRTFDGIGAISGGGGNSRLLIDYPEPQRSQLLDYLFKPGYGANLQILKFEIGGDTNSTDGAEPSHEHTRGTVDCNQGYEWWLAEQAKARNPGIKLAGLSWGAPGWIGNGNFWSQDMIDYLMSWFGCADQHHLTIDYLGGWNERGYDKAWYENLRSTLDSKGHSATKVVADDAFGWGVADAMTSDSAFRDAVDIVGSHYVCGYLSSGATCNSTAPAQALGKQLWASENGSQDADTGAAATARAINRGYIDGKMTAYINWPLIAALYPNQYFATDGMSVAAQPWSGNYQIGKTTWATAHTTQFTAPGWHYIDSASGYLGGARANGSYVTLKSTNNSDYSTVIETMDATAAQTATVKVSGGLSTGKVQVWATNLKSSDSADYFVHAPEVTPANGSYTLTLQPGYVYTVTTTSGGGKGTATPPAASALALPYSDNFETATASTSPKYFADMNGAFAKNACGGGRTGTCLRQMAATAPINWTHENYHSPYTYLGDVAWSNYMVGTDVLFEQAGTVEVLGRVGKQAKNNQGLNAYHLQLSNTGAWSIQRSDTVPRDPEGTQWAWTSLASGTVTAPGTNTWHTIALKMEGSTLSAVIDGTTVGSATDATYTSGLAGLGVTGFQTEQFDKFALTPGLHTGPITSGVPGKCVDDNGSSSTNGAHVQSWDCNGTNAQKWTYESGTLQTHGKCMDVAGQGTANGALVQLWDCNGGSNQQWIPQADGTLKSTQSGRCLDLPRGTSVNGTQLDIWDCNGGFNQKWTLP